MTTTEPIPTPRGDAEVAIDRPNGRARGLLALGHGAGGGVTTPDLLAVRDAATDAGFVVARITQPYRVLGRRAPGPAAALDEAWVAAVTAVRQSAGARLPLVVGGRSAGARVACRTARALSAAGVLALAFPLHPPGRPERSRADELDPQVRTLVVNGSADPFGVPSPTGLVEVAVIEGARHDLRRDLAELAQIVGAWLRATLRHRRAG
ncbi:MAG TPA: alpha/beta family hydrolase [Micromonosporaceae bacterium]|nr:alpha/beta family hydrolase [Micromonosporaceae bacterium]